MTESFLASATLAALLFGGGAPVPDPIKSGPQVGNPNNRSGFVPQIVTGPAAGQKLCPV
jgi:hypothetical protein